MNTPSTADIELHEARVSSPLVKERDLSRAKANASEDSDDDRSSTPGPSRSPSNVSEDEDDEGPETYPPVNDAQAETRRIEENLKNWENAEMLRRKAARESAASNVPTSESLVSRASLLWPSARRTSAATGGLGKHAALGSRESLDDSVDNPFANPVSPFGDSASTPTTPDEPFIPPTARALEKRPVKGDDVNEDPSQRPALMSSVSSYNNGKPSPPQPLGLPPPKVPPPPIVPVEEQEPAKTRWWHEYLCGCGEGPDRGGHNQAGRTNPNE